MAAYVIGYSITPADLEQNPLMKISENATETGCFITYTMISDAEGKEKQGPTIIPGRFVVNPLIWTTNISNPEELPATSVTFPEVVYHMYDYAVFYGNLRKNVGDRIRSYLENENVTRK